MVIIYPQTMGTATDVPTPHGFRQELSAMVRLAAPVVVVQLGSMLMGVVDTLMVGRVSAAAIAAVAMGNLYFYGSSIFGMGALMALDPIVSQAVGAGDEPAIARGVQRGLVLSAALAVVASVLLLFAGPVLTLLRQPGAIVPLAAAYDRIEAPGMLPFYVFVVFRQTLQARHRMAPIVLSIVAGNVINAFLNWVFIFGHLGSPALGVMGSAWATTIARWLTAAILYALCWRDILPHIRPWRADTMDLPALRRMLALGAPIGMQMELEYGVFAAAGLMMGWIGTDALAGHQIALNLASLAFMVPLGVSAAASVLVGNAIGRGDRPEARRAAGAGLVCGVAFMALSGLTMLLLPRPLAGAYTADLTVAGIAATLIPIAGVFQVFDGIQVVSIGILRGTADTRTPMLINVLGFWLIGLPVGMWLGIRQQLGPSGLWWGLTTGLVVVAFALLLRVRHRLGSEVGRVHI